MPSYKKLLVDGDNVSKLNNDAGYITSVGSVSYNDLTDKPTLFDGNYNSLSNKPSLFDGNYNSLSNKPSIPTHTSHLTNNSGYITSLSSIPATTLTGNMNLGTSSVSNKITLGTTSWKNWYRLNKYWTEFSNNANEGFKFISGGTESYVQLQINNRNQSGGNGVSSVTAYGSIYMNQNKKVATEEYVNSRGFLTSQTDSQQLSISGTSLSISGGNSVTLPIFDGQYSSLSGRPTIPTDYGDHSKQGYATQTWVQNQKYLTSQTDSQTLSISGNTLSISGGNNVSLPTYSTFSGSYNDLSNKPSLFDGNYNSLSNKPTIPTNNNQLTNGAGYLTSHQNISGKANLSGATFTGQVNVKASTPYLYVGDNVSNNDGGWDANIMIDSGSHSRLRIENRNNNKNLLLYSHANTAEPHVVATDSATKLYVGVNGTDSYWDNSGRIHTHSDGNSGNWNTAYSWGNHADAKYLTSHQSLSGYATQSWVNSQGFLKSQTDSQTLSISGKTLTISSGNSITLPTDNGYLTAIRQTGGDYTPNGTTFQNVLVGPNNSNNRAVYFDGNGSSTSVSTWYGAGNKAFSAIDVSQSYLSIWTNNSAGSWNRMLDVFGDHSLVRANVNFQSTGIITASGGDSTGWNQAYGWGDHSKAGYLTSHQSLSGYATQSWVQNQKYSTFSGSYNDLSNKPTIPSLSGYATQSWVNSQGFRTTDADTQDLSISGRTISLTNGGSVTVPASFNGTNNTTGSADRLNKVSDYSWSASTIPRNTPTGVTTSFVRSTDGFPQYGSVLNVKTYTSSDGGVGQIYFPYDVAYGGDSMRYRLGKYSGGWSSWKTVADRTWVESKNYITDAQVTHQSLAGYATESWVNSQGFLKSQTDSQTLSISGKTLTISSGNSVTLPFFDGNYNSLSNKPSIPTHTSHLTNNSGYITGLSYASLTSKPTHVVNATLNSRATASPDTAGDALGVTFNYMQSNATNKPSGTDHSLMTMAYSSAWQTQIAQDWRNSGRMYIRGQNNSTWSSWGQVWSSHDFSQTSINNWQTAYGWGNHADQKYSKFSGSYNDLSNKPTIPTNNNQLSNGAGYITNTQNTLGMSRYNEIRDTRSGDITPNDHVSHRMMTGFTAAIPGSGVPGSLSGNWMSYIHMKGWSDGYASWELIGGSTTSLYEDLYVRFGKGTSWNSAKRIWHSGDFDSTKVSNWNSAYGWGNHASQGYLKSHQSLSGYATQSWVNSQGFGTSSFSGSYNDLTNKPTINASAVYNQAINPTRVRCMSGNDRSKITFWNGTTYGIGMHSSVSLGALGDYAMTFQMNNDTDRGFWWGHNGDSLNAGAMSLTTDGRLYVADQFQVGRGRSHTNALNSAYTAEFYGHTLVSSGNLYIDGQGIGSSDVQNFKTAYGWGNHASQGYLTSSSTINASAVSGLGINSSTTNNQANKLMRTDGNGYAHFGWINTTSGKTTSDPNRIYASNDQYMRYMIPADFGKFIGQHISYSSLSGKPSLFSGNYNDLSNKPTIPTNNNQLTNGAGYVTTDTNTTYTAGTGMSLSGTTFNCTVVNTDTNTTYSAGTGITLSGTTFSIGQSVATNANVVFKGFQANGTALFNDTIRGKQNVTFDRDLSVVGTITYGKLAQSKSDRRLKKDIQPLETPLDKVSKLEGKKFKWKDDNAQDFGVIAQEVEKVLPELTSEDKEGYKSVNYQGMIPYLIESIKELKNEIETLKSKTGECCNG